MSPRSENDPEQVALPGVRLGIVVLTWNGRDDTLACLRSLLPQLGAGDRVEVVDNGSADGTEQAVRAAFPQVGFTQNGANLGFAGGNNPGLRRALAGGADWVLLLNNDTLVPERALDALRRAAREAAPEVGVLQPLLVRAEDPRRVDSAGHELGRLPGVRDLAAGRPVADLPDAAVEVFGACGAAALLRRGALEAAGLLDEELFVLFEDVDLMFRIRAAGLGVQLLPAVRIHHRRGVSGAPRSPRRRFWAQRNIVALALRWWPWPALLLAAPLLTCRAALALWLGARHGAGPSLPLWRSALRARRLARRAMRRYRVDVWFGRRPLG
jgi:GT2 family glycosyltransferase